MRNRFQSWCAAACLVAVSTTVFAQSPLVESRFESGEEGWTQVNLGADYRYLDDLDFEGDCRPGAEAGTFRCCDPDPGAWMFQAPPKFLGNQLAALDGSLAYSLRWTGEGNMDEENLLPHVVLVSNDKGLAYVFPSEPPINEWVSNRIVLDEHAGWLWMDDSTGMEALPRATREQVAQVLSALTAVRIRGEFITGNDQAFLDNVVLAAPASVEAPRLSLRLKATGRVELSWPASALNYVLQATDQLTPSAVWSSVSTGGQTTIELDASSTVRFFRLHKP